MTTSVIPQNYEEWRHCITVDCGLELTPQYIAQRTEALQNEKDYYTQQYVKLYGPQYLQQVLAWFVQAQKTENATAE